MFKTLLLSLVILTGCGVLAPLAAAQGEDVANRMEALIEQRKFQDAYDLGTRAAGSAAIEHDLWLGVAAAETGRGKEAVDLLRRFMSVHPRHAQIPRARLELGRALVIVGEPDLALKEFEAVLAGNPPEAVMRNIRRFTELIPRGAQAAPPLTGYVELGLGHDSNVNGGVGNANVSLPVLGLVELNPGGVKADATFARVAVGAELNLPLAERWTAMAGVHGEQTLLDTHREYELGSVTVNGGLAWRGATQHWKALLSHEALALDHNGYRQSNTLNLEMLQPLTPTSMVSVTAAAGELRYEGDNAPRGARVQSLGAAYQQAFAGALQPTLTLALNLGWEDNVRGRPDLGRSIHGARVALGGMPAAGWSASVGATWQESRYEGVDPLLQITRKDSYSGVDLVVSRQLRRDLTLRAEATHARNDSNAALWQHDRTVFALKLRQDFR